MNSIDNDEIEKITKNVRNAFSNVAKVEEEIDYLSKDFIKIIDEEYGFKFLKSTSYKDSREWRFKPKQQDDDRRLISLTISFSYSYPKEFDNAGPRLIVGVLENLRYMSGWLYDAYHNDNNDYDYKQNCKECKKGEWKDGEVINFNFGGADSENKGGCFFDQPLLKVNNREHVKSLVDKVVKECWNGK